MLFHLGIVLLGVLLTLTGAVAYAPNSGDNWCESAMPGGNEPMSMHVEVELDIFSGMPNPTWALTNDEAESFARQLAALSPNPATELANNLGYRGFLVQLTRRTDVQSIRVYRNVVEVSKNSTRFYARDQDRALEWWLLNTGRPHMKDDVFQLVEREMR